jgi:hypothetical protein
MWSYVVSSVFMLAIAILISPFTAGRKGRWKILAPDAPPMLAHPVLSVESVICPWFRLQLELVAKLLSAGPPVGGDPEGPLVCR